MDVSNGQISLGGTSILREEKAPSNVDGIVVQIARTSLNTGCVSENPALHVEMKLAMRFTPCDLVAYSLGDAIRMDVVYTDIGSAKGA